MGTDLEFGYVADQVICHNNITHYHLIKEYEFRIDSQHLDEVIRVILNRNLWFMIEPFLSQDMAV